LTIERRWSPASGFKEGKESFVRQRFACHRTRRPTLLERGDQRSCSRGAIW
jgi:hypothetical protein